MNIPSTLRILGKEWTIEQVDEIHAAFGLCHKSKLKIQIEKGLKEDLQLDILIHEVMHAIDWSMNTGLTEAQNTALSTGLAAVILDNPAFAECLCRRKKKSTTT